MAIFAILLLLSTAQGENLISLNTTPECAAYAKELFQLMLTSHFRTLLQINPSNADWSNPRVALKDALDTEKEILNLTITAHTCAQNHNDPDLLHHIAEGLIVGEENIVFELASYISRLSGSGSHGTGPLLHLNQLLYDKYKGYKNCFHVEKHDNRKQVF